MYKPFKNMLDAHADIKMTKIHYLKITLVVLSVLAILSFAFS